MLLDLTFLNQLKTNSWSVCSEQTVNKPSSTIKQTGFIMFLKSDKKQNENGYLYAQIVIELGFNRVLQIS